VLDTFHPAFWIFAPFSWLATGWFGLRLGRGKSDSIKRVLLAGIAIGVVAGCLNYVIIPAIEPAVAAALNFASLAIGRALGIKRGRQRVG